MTIMRRVVFSQVEILKDSTLQVRLEKQIVDGENILATDYHRTVLPRGTDPDEQFAIVNAHLALMGYPPVESDTIERVRRIAAAAMASS